MQSKRNVCTNQRLTAKAFFKIILLVPTQSGLYFRVLLIKYKISLWQLTMWLADKTIGGRRNQNKTYRPYVMRNFHKS